MNVTIDGNTRLVLKETKGGVSLFSEFYFNFETGNVFSVPADATPEEIEALYRAKNA